MESVVRYASRRPMPAAVVADVASAGGLAAIRSLDRAGVPVIAADHRPDAVGLGSRLALALRLPPPGSPRFVERLVELGGILRGRAVLLPTSAEYARALADARAPLADALVCAFPDAGVVATVAAAGDGRRGGECVVVAAALDADGDALGVFAARTTPGGDVVPGADAAATERGAEELRRLGVRGLGWVELAADDGPVVAAGAHLWSGHAHALRAGVDLPRLAYWISLGARPQLATGPRRRWRPERPFALADPGPALAGIARDAGRL
jgi:hypothetical protein